MSTYEERRAEEMNALENTKLGDTFYRYNGWSPIPDEVKVTKVTATQIVFNDEIRINRKSGHIVGGSTYDRRFYKPVTPSSKAAVEEAIRNAKATGAKKETIKLFTDFATALSNPDDIIALHEQIKALIAKGTAK